MTGPHSSTASFNLQVSSVRKVHYTFSCFCRTMLCISADFAMARCPSWLAQSCTTLEPTRRSAGSGRVGSKKLQARAGPAGWLAGWMIECSGRSGSASEDDPAERGCSRSKTTLGSTPTTPGGSHMTASLGGRYDPWPVKRSSEWVSRAQVSGETLCNDIYPARPITTVSLAANTYCMMGGLSSSAPRTVGRRVQFSGACERSHLWPTSAYSRRPSVISG